MKKTYRLLPLLLILAQAGIQAQTAPIRRLHTQTLQRQLGEKAPYLADSLSATERFVKAANQLEPAKEALIPVAFHLLYGPGQTPPGREQILSQLDALNRDFAVVKESGEAVVLHPADTLEGFATRAADTQIRFCLAQSGFQEGIGYHEVNTLAWGLDPALQSAEQGGANPWPVGQYLNVWVAFLSDTISGWAQMPGGPAETDGIVIDRRYFGVGGTALAPYDEGKTLTHLVGNSLGLHDLWNESDPCADDYVADTPIHNAPNAGCFDHRHVSTCHDNPVEMTMNFMDNSDDACQYLFTLGQKMRLQAMLAPGGPRAGLLSGSAACAPLFEGEKPVISVQPHNQAVGPAMAVFPNPAGASFQLQLDPGNPAGASARVTVFNTLGAQVAAWRYDLIGGTNTFTIPSADWPAGVYWIRTEIGGIELMARLAVGRG